MLRFIFLTLAICHLCIASPVKDNSSYVYSASYSSSSGGDLYCGSLTCPKNSNRCIVTKKSSEDEKWIEIIRQCWENCKCKTGHENIFLI